MIVESSADQKLTPAAVAPCRTMPAMLSTPAMTASSITPRARAAKRSDAVRHCSPAPATSASAGSQIAIRKKTVPTASAIEAYCTRGRPRTPPVSPSPTWPCCASSSETVAPVALARPWEHGSPARHRVAVRRDHAVGRGAALLEPRLELDGQVGPRPPGWKTSPLSTRCPARSKTRIAPKLPSTGSLNLNTICSGGRFSVAPSGSVLWSTA